jgi:oligosaccharide repeat unit polymerase
MTTIQIICLITIIFILVFSFRKNLDLFSPARIFTLLWAVLIFLIEFKFSGFQHVWATHSWIVLLIGLFAFILGIYISFVNKSDTKVFTINEIRERIKQSKPLYNRDNFFYILTFLVAAYFFSLIAEIMIEGYIPVFHPEPDVARVDFGVFGLHLFVQQMPVILFLVIEFFIIGSGSRFRKIAAVIFFILVFLSYFLLMQRFNYFYWLVMTFGLMYYSTRLMNFRNSVILLGSFFTFFFWLTTIRLSQYAAQFYYVTSKMNYHPKYASFTGVYMYLVMNVENFARGVVRLENHTYSAMTLDWIYALTGLKHWMKNYFGYVHNPHLNSGYTTFPFLWDYFIDFGILGVTILPIITGYLIGRLYYYMRSKGTLEGVVYYSICLFLLLISFFVNPLTMLSVVSNIFVLWLIHRYFIYKKVQTV